MNLSIETLPTVIPTEHFYPADWQPGDAAYACIEVKDTGCGIEEEDLNKLFDPFFSNKFTGRGLGLPVVLGIVKAHDGAVSVETEVGKGSIFRVFLPVFNAAKVAERQVVAKIIPQDGGGTILLVDDEDAVREMAEAMLSRLGLTGPQLTNGTVC